MRRRRSEAEEPATALPSESELDGSGDGALRCCGRGGDEEGEEGKGKKSSTSGREDAAAARRGRRERRGGGDGERQRDGRTPALLRAG